MSSDSPKDVESGKNLVFGKILRFPGVNWAQKWTSFKVWIFTVLDLTWKIHLIFWLGDPIGPNFRGFWTITLANNVGFG